MRMKNPKGFAEEPAHFRAEDGVRHERQSRKRAVNVTVQEHILAQAKEMKLNLSQVLEDELKKRLREERTRRFQEENRDAIESHNRFIEKHGIWSEKFRTW